jgi:hypothetical protein
MRRVHARLLSFGWQLTLAALTFIQVVATFRSLMGPLYVARWLAGVGVVACFVALGRFRVSTTLAREFLLITAIVTLGLLAQLDDNLDMRALALATSYTLTATAAFLIAPSTFRRRAVRRLVWPAMLVGVAAATLLGEYLGLRDPLGSIAASSDRWRFFGAFFQPNAAGTAGLLGLILAGAAFTTRPRWWYLATVPFFIIVMLLADSRGSILAAAALVGGWGLVQVLRWPVRKLAFAATVVALFALGAGLRNSARLEWPDLSRTPHTLNEVSSGRWANWTLSLSYLESPVQWSVGLGLSRNFSFLPMEAGALNIPIRGSSADSFYIDLIGRTGLIGLALFLAMIASLYLRTWRTPEGALPVVHRERAFGIGVLAATIALGATNSAIVTWGWLHAAVAWPLVAAAATRRIDARPDASPGRAARVDD